MANRGEIALRVIRTARELGIRVVAVYSTADKGAGYVASADEAYLLGPPPPSESYLRIDKIIKIAKRARVQAIHPGYGFLAENPDFAAVCEKEGIIFIGPSSRAIRVAGNKMQAKALAQRHGIPVIPWGSAAKVPRAKRMATRIGYPVLIKAAAGGGGRGMRVVSGPRRLVPALREAASEARSAFSDPTLFIERYLERPRHVEIQILADKLGNIIHLGERECSIQRRHQKLIEESPSPFVDDQLRTKMGQTACKIARLTGYTNAGTVEFLLDKDRRFYFLEINSRLQVEHPVTEALTNLDLVAQQIKIASGERLELAQGDVNLQGHAIECRICAEDPFADFSPSTGEILGLEFPKDPSIRVDTDLRAGYNVSLYYDSLLAKFISWGQDRGIAIARMLDALRKTRIVGIKTTIPLYIRILQDKDFLKGCIDTGFIGSKEGLLKPVPEGPLLPFLLAGILEYQRQKELRPKVEQKVSAWRAVFIDRRGSL